MKTKKNIIYLLIISIILSCGVSVAGDSMAAVALAGGIIKAKNIDNNKKYKRKDCPVCKGKGWYMSGDGISKVSCGYCEEEKKEVEASTQTPVPAPAPPRTIIRRR